MVSGLWTSTFALGSFIGPSVAGVMYDYVGFEYSTLFVVVFNFALVSIVVIQVRRQHNFTFLLSFFAPLCFCAWSGGRLSVYRLLQKPLLDTVRWMLELAKILM
jgi:MFS family permease